MAALPCAKEIIDNLAETAGSITCAVGSIPLYAAQGTYPDEEDVRVLGKACQDLQFEIDGLLGTLGATADTIKG